MVARQKSALIASEVEIQDRLVLTVAGEDAAALSWATDAGERRKSALTTLEQGLKKVMREARSGKSM